VSPPLLLVQRNDPAITLLTLNRPEKRNALSVGLIESLRDEIAADAKDPLRRAIVLLGNGPSFCAGLDLTEAGPGGAHERSAEALASLYEALGNSPLITIAVARGAAMGGGAGLLAACDFVLAADDLRLAYPEVRRGLVAALVTCLLRRRLTDHATRDLVLLGQTMDAPRALELRLVDRIARVDELDSAATAFAREALKGAPGAIARTKKLLDALAARPLKEDLRIALDFHLAARRSDEAVEGIAAFHEKREPCWGPRPSKD
jgi:methylglutaconyl-CoA hydratase